MVSGKRLYRAIIYRERYWAIPLAFAFSALVIIPVASNKRMSNKSGLENKTNMVERVDIAQRNTNVIYSPSNTNPSY